MSALRELIAFFGVEVDDKQIDSSEKKLEGFKGALEQTAAAVGLAFGVKEIGEFVKGQIEVGAELLHTSEMLGLSVGDLQAFQYAAANAGLSAEEATTGLRFLNKNLGEAATKGGDAAAAFQKLGVHVKDADGKIRPTQDIFAEVADGIAKLPSPAEKTAKAMELFGRAGARLIPLLNKGSKGIEQFYDEFEKLGGGIDEEFVQAAEEGEHQMNKLNLVWRTSKSVIASALIPAFTWLVEKITDMVSWMRELSTHSHIVGVTLAVLGGIVGVLALVWAALNIEIFLVLAAFALIVLVIDDVYTALTGGKSVIGDFIDSIFGIGTTKAVVDQIMTNFHNLTAALGEAWDATKELVGAFRGVDEQAPKSKVKLEDIISAVAAIGAAFVEAVHLVADFERALTSVFVKYNDFKKAHPALVGKIEGLGSSAVSAIEGGATASDAAKNPLNLVGSLLGGAPEYAIPRGGGGGPGSVDVTNHNSINVEVKGGTTNADTGSAVAGGVTKGITDADIQAGYAGLIGSGGF